MTCSGTFGGGDCKLRKNCPCMRGRIAGMLDDVCMCVPGARPVGTGMHREGAGKRRISCAIDEGARRADLVGIGRSGGFCKAGQSRAGAPAGGASGTGGRQPAPPALRCTTHGCGRSGRPAHWRRAALAPSGAATGLRGGGQRAHGAHRQGAFRRRKRAGSGRLHTLHAAQPRPPRPEPAVSSRTD